MTIYHWFEKETDRLFGRRGVMSRPYIDATGEAVLNPGALPEPIRDWQRVRLEYRSDDSHYAFLEIPVYLPPDVDVTEVIDVMNGFELYGPVEGE